MKTEDGFEAISVDKLSLSFTCRTCLNTDPDQQLTAIFEKTESCGNLTDDLREQLSLLNSKIAKDDGYPYSLCSICVERLVAVHAFRKQCEKAQEYLERYFINVPDVPDIKSNELVNLVEESKNEEKGKDLDPPKGDENDDPNDGGFESDDSSSEYKPDNIESSSEDETLADLKKQISKDNDKLTCPICEKTFKTAAIRNNHLYLHKDYNAFPCDECDQAFKCRSYLKKHKRTYHSVGDYACPICDKKFTITSRYDYHLKTHDKEKKYKCRHCDKSFVQYAHRKSHEMTHVDKVKHIPSFLCNICGKNLKYDSTLKKHMKLHDDSERYPCHICNKVFAQKGGLKLHLVIHSKVRAYQCDQCGKKFVQNSALKEHLRLHNAVRPHHCELCKESFLRIRALRRHYLGVHGQTEKSVKFNKKLQENEDTATETLAPKEENTGRSGRKYPYACNLCSRTFKVPSALTSHMSAHKEERKFSCSECGDAFKTMRNLELHVDIVHLKLKPYSCEICKKTFARVGDRNVHMQIHSEEKPHRCTFCEKRFNMVKALRAHLRHHTGERPFVCIICNAAYTCHKTLASHTRRIHADDPQVLRKVEELAQTVLSTPTSAKVEDGSSALEAKSEDF